MFDRVEMDVINVPGQVIIVPNRMLPKAPLPDGSLTSLLSGLVTVSNGTNFC